MQTPANADFPAVRPSKAFVDVVTKYVAPVFGTEVSAICFTVIESIQVPIRSYPARGKHQLGGDGESNPHFLAFRVRRQILYGFSLYTVRSFITHLARVCGTNGAVHVCRRLHMESQLPDLPKNPRQCYLRKCYNIEV